MSSHQNIHSAASGKPVLSTAAKNSKRNLIVVLVSACVLAVAAGGTFLWIKSKEPPRFNAPPDKFARFVASPALNKLPFDQQMLYIEKLDDRADEVHAAWETGKLSDQEYKAALEFAWFAPHLRNMSTYHQLPTPNEKTAMLDMLLDEKELKKGKSKAGSADSSSKEAQSIRPKPKRDELREELIPQAWPEAERIRWIQFRLAMKQRDIDRDKAKKAQEKAAKKAAAMAVPTQPAK